MNEYNWQDDYVEDGKLKDGFYYIKKGRSESLESVLPPTRCIEIKDSKWKSHDCDDIDYWYIYQCDIASPAFVVGKMYEFSIDGKDYWVEREYVGYNSGKEWPHMIKVDIDPGDITYQSYKYCREIKEDVIKIGVNGRGIRLTNEQINEIKKYTKIFGMYQ